MLAGFGGDYSVGVAGGGDLRLGLGSLRSDCWDFSTGQRLPIVAVWSTLGAAPIVASLWGTAEALFLGSVFTKPAN